MLGAAWPMGFQYAPSGDDSVPGWRHRHSMPRLPPQPSTEGIFAGLEEPICVHPVGFHRRLGECERNVVYIDSNGWQRNFPIDALETHQDFARALAQ